MFHKAWQGAKTQKELMEQNGFLALIKPEKFCEKYIDAFYDKNPVIIYSMWEGCLNPKHKAYKKDWDDFLKAQEAKGIEIKYLHTSGHATAKMIEDVIKAVNPQEEIIPIHTENPERFMELDIGSEYREVRL
jgi:ribonuclease J